MFDMAGPSHEHQKRQWEKMTGYFARGPAGEAGMELREAVEEYKASESNRWSKLVKDFPFAITGVDPAESLNPALEHCELFITFIQASRIWLQAEFVQRPNEFWEEMASFGCYWVRFKFESDLRRYQEAFSKELRTLDFSDPKYQQ